MITKRQITDAKRGAKRWHRDQRHGGSFYECRACRIRREHIMTMIEQRADAAFAAHRASECRKMLEWAAEQANICDMMHSGNLPALEMK